MFNLGANLIWGWLIEANVFVSERLIIRFEVWITRIVNIKAYFDRQGSLSIK